jgi:hypothetical protein
VITEHPSAKIEFKDGLDMQGNEGLGASGSPPPGLGLGDGLQGLAVLIDEQRHVSQHSARLHRVGQGRAHVVSVLQDKLVGDAVGRLQGGLVSRQDSDVEGDSLHRGLQGSNSKLDVES